MKIFRPRRAADLQELPDWILRTSKEEAEEMHKQDKPRGKKNENKSQFGI
jgi:hypothetical protein